MEKSSIIIVDDDPDFLQVLKTNLINSGFKTIRTEYDPIKASLVFRNGKIFDIAIIDMTMPGMDGIELLEIIKETSPVTECIMVTAVNEARVAVQCLKKGAYDYLLKPVSQQDLIFSIKRTLERKRLLDIIDIKKNRTISELRNPGHFKSIITRSQNVLSLLKEAELHAESDVPVLITGESGTGKELLAHSIHLASPRSKNRFTPVNMASLTPNLFEAEFFGHTKGAFTGAQNQRTGYIEHTNYGTLFLDEIGDLPLDLQGKLLRVLQDGEFIKIGNSKSQKADIRFIAATNQDLDKLMAKNQFRKDLYYRIRGGWLNLPPLRERIEDIPFLANKFLQDCKNSSKKTQIHDDAMSLLIEYSFPGNIRELKSMIQSAINLAQGRIITPNFFPHHIQKQKIIKTKKNKNYENIVSLAQIQREYILKAYEFTGKNKSKTARLLGIGLNTLRRRLKSYRLK